MKAIVVNSFGNSDVLEICELQTPQPSENEVLVKVEAFSINPIDCKFRQKGYTDGNSNKFPIILGMDFAGTIIEVGKKGNKNKIGESVYGFTDMMKMGSYAEFLVIDESEIGIIPKGMNFIDAAALPMVAVTSLISFNCLDDFSNKNILINGASGGVGHIAVQMAKNKKAIVYGTSSNKNISFLNSLMIDFAIDYESTEIEKFEAFFDIVIDVAGNFKSEVFNLIKPKGTLISVATQPNYRIAKEKLIRAYFVWAESKTELMDVISEMFSSKQISPKISNIFTFEEIKSAHKLLETGHTVGKIVMTI